MEKDPPWAVDPQLEGDGTQRVTLQSNQPRLTALAEPVQVESGGRLADATNPAFAVDLLLNAKVRIRPNTLTDAECSTAQIFLEKPPIRRAVGSDRWVTSGGKAGATEMWNSPQHGVLKRYGRLVRRDRPSVKYVQFNFICRSLDEEGNCMSTFTEDKSIALWILKPDAESSETKSQSKGSALEMAQRPQNQDRPRIEKTGLVVQAAAQQSFISFRDTAASGDAGIELGAVVRGGDGGVKLVSSQGDFAEWHKRASGEPPFEEGDVVGFSRGRISRSTRRCEMLGIITRKAVVEGSGPPACERHLYDTVAYSGVVPVKVSTPRKRGKPCECLVPMAGHLLVPSGKEDGTAILVSPEGSSVSVARVGILLHNDSSNERAEETTIDHPSSNAGSESSSQSVALVEAVVVPPSETVPPVLARRSAQLRGLAALITALAMACVAVVLWFASGPMMPKNAVAPEPSQQIGGPSTVPSSSPVPITFECRAELLKFCRQSCKPRDMQQEQSSNDSNAVCSGNVMALKSGPGAPAWRCYDKTKLKTATNASENVHEYNGGHCFCDRHTEIESLLQKPHGCSSGPPPPSLPSRPSLPPPPAVSIVHAHFRSPVFTNGHAGITCYRMPALIQSARHSLLGFAEARHAGGCAEEEPEATSGSVHLHSQLVLRRSLDEGSSWLPMEFLLRENVTMYGGASSPRPITVDDDMIVLIYLYRRGYQDARNSRAASIDEDRWSTGVGVIRSTDSGMSWSPHSDVSPGFAVATSPHSTVMASSAGTLKRLGTGIAVKAAKLPNGQRVMRILVTTFHQSLDSSGHLNSSSCITSSTDHGISWETDPTTCFQSVASAGNLAQMRDGHLLRSFVFVTSTLELREEVGGGYEHGLVHRLAFSTSASADGLNWAHTHFMDDGSVSPDTHAPPLQINGSEQSAAVVACQMWASDLGAIDDDVYVSTAACSRQPLRSHVALDAGSAKSAQGELHTVRELEHPYNLTYHSTNIDAVKWETTLVVQSATWNSDSSLTQVRSARDSDVFGKHTGGILYETYANTNSASDAASENGIGFAQFDHQNHVHVGF